MVSGLYSYTLIISIDIFITHPPKCSSSTISPSCSLSTMYFPITPFRCSYLSNLFKYADSSNPEKLSVDNPATGDLVSDQIPIAGSDDVDRAVHAAKAAFAPGSEWRSMTAATRQRLLFRFADLLEENQERLAYLTRLTLGAPYKAFGQGEIAMAIGCFRCG